MMTYDGWKATEMDCCEDEGPASRETVRVSYTHDTIPCPPPAGCFELESDADIDF